MYSQVEKHKIALKFAQQAIDILESNLVYYREINDFSSEGFHKCIEYFTSALHNCGVESEYLGDT